MNRHLTTSLKILCIPLFTGLLISNSTEARSKTCAIERGHTSVKLVPRYGKVAYNNGHSALQLGTKFGQHGKIAHRLGWVTRGLTKTSLERRLNIKIKYQEQANNRVCAVLSEATLEIGYDQFRVYIARQHKPGACEYRTTLDHENTHVRIYQTTLRKYIPRLERKLRQSTVQLRPIEASSAARAQRHFISKIERDLQLILNEMSREMDKANGRIDTVKNYKREQALCPPGRR